MTRVAVVDVDGTLVDTNYHHAVAWYRAFRRVGLIQPLWQLHRHVGMGGDQYVAAVAGPAVERAHGDLLRQAWTEEFDKMLGEVSPLEGASDLLAALRATGARVVLASSGKRHHVEHFLDLVDGRRYAEAWTTSDDVERTKPAPDLVQVALEKVGGGRGTLLGDSPWDCRAAARAGIPAVAVRTGGFPDRDLEEAGAVAVYDSLPALQADLADTPLGESG